MKAELYTPIKRKIKVLMHASTEYIGLRVVFMKNIEPRKELMETRITNGRKKLPLTKLIGLFSRWTTSHAFTGLIKKYLVRLYKNLKSMYPLRM
jgi:hypothetical protein